MSMIRCAIRSRLSLRSSDPVTVRTSLPFLQEWRKCLSTTTEETPASPSPPSPKDSPVGGSNKRNKEDKFYGKVSGFSKHTLKTDVMNLLDGCNLTPDDLKFSYARGANLEPSAVYVQFSSGSAYDSALKAISKKGRLYRLEKASRPQWDPITPYEGKVVALHGLPVNASVDDIERFFTGCQYHPGSMQFLTVQDSRNSKRVVLVRFTSQTQAMNAYITKNRTFLLNNRITLQVLQ